MKTLEDNLLFGCLVGSLAHGTDNEQSDVDIRGIYSPDEDDAIGPFPRYESINLRGDSLIYEIRKFGSMVASCNPNILEILWSPDNLILYSHPAWEIFRAEKHNMLSRQIYNSYGGFSNSALKSLKKEIASKDSLNSEQIYKMNKAFSHCIRHLRMGHEALDGHGILVNRYDKNELSAIKLGKIPLEECLETIEVLKNGLDEKVLQSKLPNEIPYRLITKTMASTLRSFWASDNIYKVDGVMKKLIDDKEVTLDLLENYYPKVTFS